MSVSYTSPPVNSTDLPAETRRFLAALDSRPGAASTFFTYDDDDERGPTPPGSAAKRGPKLRPRRPALTRTLHGAFDAPGHVLWPASKARPRRREPLRGTIADALARLNAAGASVCVLVHGGNGRGREDTDIVETRAVWLEFDGGAPPSWGADDLPPSIEVETSPGHRHYYWLLATPGEISPPEATSLNGVLAARYGGDPGTLDAARVLRVPGYLHQKVPSRSHVVRLLTPAAGEPVRRYTATELRSWLPEADDGACAPAPVAPRPVLPIRPWSAERVRDALSVLPRTAAARHPDDRPPGYRQWWVEIGMALHHLTGGASEGADLYHEWSVLCDGYAGPDDVADRWRSFRRGDGAAPVVTWASVEHRAREYYGWVDPDWGLDIDPADLAAAALPAVPPPVAEDEPQTAVEWALARGGHLDDRGARELMQRLNREYAILTSGRRAAVLHIRRCERGYLAHDHVEPAAMRHALSGITVPGPPKVRANRDEVPTRIPAWQAWEGWAGHRAHRGVGFFPPGVPVPTGYHNTWAGFGLTPTDDEAGWMASPLRRHIVDVYCAGDESLATWVLDWCADVLQRPGAKSGSALALISPERGTGKSMLPTVLSAMLGTHAMTLSQPSQVTGKFNAHLRETLLGVVEEAVWAGDKAAEGALKELITGGLMAVEAKGRDVVTVRNHTKFIFLSNNEWVLPVGISERRYCILDVRTDRPNDRNYFDTLWSWIGIDRAGGGDRRGARIFMGHLLGRRITSDLASPPETAALRRQRGHSLTRLQQWLRDLADTGEIERRGVVLGTLALSESDRTAIECSVVRADVLAACRPHTREASERAIGQLLAEAGVARVRRSVGVGERRWHYDFPPLARFQGAVYATLKLGDPPPLPPIDPGEAGDVDPETAVREAMR